MTITLTYDDTEAYVSIDADGFAAAVDAALIERSTDQVVWTTVRGGVEWPVSSGAFTNPLKDYEFTPGVVNHYRVRGIDFAAISFVAAGVADSGSSGSRSPAAPAGIVADDLVLILASTRNSGTGTVDTPANWQALANFGNMKLIGRVYDGVWTMPTITFTNGAANEDTIAQSAAFRNTALNPVIVAETSLNSSAQDIAVPALNVNDDDLLLIAAAWKQDDWTSVAALTGLTGWAEISEPDSTAGDDAGQVWDYLVQSDAEDSPVDSFVVTGGAAAISRSLILGFEKHAYMPSQEQTADITPDMTKIWLKSLTRPFLNVAIATPCVAMGEEDIEMLVAQSPVVRRARAGVFPIVNRTYGIAVSDIRTGREWDVRLRTFTELARRSIDFLLASGDVLLLHIPAGDCAVTIEGGYVTAFDASYQRHKRYRHRVVWDFGVQEVAPPGPDIMYAEATWQTVISTYGTWADVLAAHATWASVIAMLPDPSEVIVP